MARPKDLGLEHTWRTRSRAEGDSRSAAKKVWQHESLFSRQRARGNPAARVGVVGPKRVVGSLPKPGSRSAGLLDRGDSNAVNRTA